MIKLDIENSVDIRNYKEIAQQKGISWDQLVFYRVNFSELTFQHRITTMRVFEVGGVPGMSLITVRPDGVAELLDPVAPAVRNLNEFCSIWDSESYSDCVIFANHQHLFDFLAKRIVPIIL